MKMGDKVLFEDNTIETITDIEDMIYKAEIYPGFKYVFLTTSNKVKKISNEEYINLKIIETL